MRIDPCSPSRRKPIGLPALVAFGVVSLSILSEPPAAQEAAAGERARRGVDGGASASWVVAVVGAEAGSVSLARRDERGVLQEIPGLDRIVWDRFGLRGPGPPSAGPLGIREVMDGPLPHLEVDRGARGQGGTPGPPGPSGPRVTRLAAFHRDVPERSGFAAIGGGRAEVLLAEASGRYRLVPGGACASPDGAFVAAVVGGAVAAAVGGAVGGGIGGSSPGEIVILDLRGSFPAARSVPLPDGTASLAPSTLTLTADSAFFAARGADQAWRAYRVPLAPPSHDGASILAEPIAGPFAHMGESFASSPSAVAFLAGAGPREVDVLAAGAEGPATNVTRSPGDILPHSPERTSLAVSDDGSAVAYNVPTPVSRELFLARTSGSGETGRAHITSDDRFHPYIDQESLIFFIPGGLVFAGGHEPETADLFRVSLFDEADVVNLTRSAGGAAPPFLVTGTLEFRTAVIASDRALLVEASGFPTGAPEGLIVIDGGTGEPLGERVAASGASGLVSVGGEIHFRARGDDGRWTLYRAGEAGIEAVATAEAGSEPVLLLRSGDRTFHLVPPAGLVEVAAGAPPRILLREDGLLPPASLAAGGGELILGRSRGEAVERIAVDLATGLARPLFEAPSREVLLDALDPEAPFVRGDANRSGLVDVSDPIAILSDLFLATEAILCPDGADANDDGRIDVADAIHALGALFLGGPTFPPPFPEPGLDPTPDGLGCPAP